MFKIDFFLLFLSVCFLALGVGVILDSYMNFLIPAGFFAEIEFVVGIVFSIGGLSAVFAALTGIDAQVFNGSGNGYESPSTGNSTSSSLPQDNYSSNERPGNVYDERYYDQ